MGPGPTVVEDVSIRRVVGMGLEKEIYKTHAGCKLLGWQTLH